MSLGGGKPRPTDLSLGFYLVLGSVVALGPLSVDMYLPALPALATSLGASDGATQMTITAFLLGSVFGPVILGPISDAVGRRRPILVSLVGYSLVSLSIATVGSVEMMIGLRLAQSFAGGSAFSLARGMFRDILSGDALARAMSVMMMIVLGAPIVAPFLGGFILLVRGWRTIFVVLAVMGGLTFVAVWRRLPETLPPERRRPLNVMASLRGYASITRSRSAVAYAVCGGGAAAVLFSYLAAAPFIYIEYYGFDEQWFGALFGIAVVGAWLAQMFNIRYVVRIGYHRVVLIGAVCLAGLAVVLLWVTRTDFGGLAGVVTTTVVVVSLTHLVTPGALTGVLDEFPDMAGSASGFATFVRFAIGAAGSGAVGLFNDGTPKTFGAVVVAFSAIALIAAAAARPPKSNNPT